MIGDERVAFVAFTGSVGGGHAVQRAASGALHRDRPRARRQRPGLRARDAPLEATIENLVDGAFFNAGQSCCAVERIYVHRDVYDDFVEGFVELTKQYRLGNPLDPETTLGPMVRTDAADNLRHQVDEAIAMGAKRA